MKNNNQPYIYNSLLRSYKSVNDIIGAAWQQEEHK